MQIERIPDGIDMDQLAKELVQALRDYRSSGGTLSHVAKVCNVSAPSISKAFSVWPKSESTLYSSNKLAISLCNYYLRKTNDRTDLLVAALGKSEVVRDIYLLARSSEERNESELNYSDSSEMSAEESGRLISSGYTSLYRMLGVHHVGSERTLTRVQGTYIGFRNSKIDGRLVFSSIRISKRPNSTGIWEYFHDRTDKQGRYIKSEGVVIPVKSNMYFISDIEEGGGLEYIVARMPFEKKVFEMDGFITTIGYDGAPICARFGFVRRDIIRELLSNSIGLINLIGSFDRDYVFSQWPELEPYISKFCNDKWDFNAARTVFMGDL